MDSFVLAVREGEEGDRLVSFCCLVAAEGRSHGAALCQAVHAWVRWNPGIQKTYGRLVARNPKRKKIAVVAMMRRLCIRLWQAARDARRRRAAGHSREGEEQT